MLRYFAAIVGIAALIEADLGSGHLFEGIALPLLFAACLVIVIGWRGALIIGAGIWLLAHLDLDGESVFGSIVVPLLLIVDLLALVVWAWRRGWLKHARRGAGDVGAGGFWGGWGGDS